VTFELRAAGIDVQSDGNQRADMELLRNRLDETLRHYQRLMKKMG